MIAWMEERFILTSWKMVFIEMPSSFIVNVTNGQEFCTFPNLPPPVCLLKEIPSLNYFRNIIIALNALKATFLHGFLVKLSALPSYSWTIAWQEAIPNCICRRLYPRLLIKDNIE